MDSRRVALLDRIVFKVLKYEAHIQIGIMQYFLEITCVRINTDCVTSCRVTFN